jgi:hypothetical protein
MSSPHPPEGRSASGASTQRPSLLQPEAGPRGAQGESLLSAIDPSSDATDQEARRRHGLRWLVPAGAIACVVAGIAVTAPHAGKPTPGIAGRTYAAADPAPVPAPQPPVIAAVPEAVVESAASARPDPPLIGSHASEQLAAAAQDVEPARPVVRASPQGRAAGERVQRSAAASTRKVVDARKPTAPLATERIETPAVPSMADVEILTALVRHIDGPAAFASGPTMAGLVSECTAQGGEEAARCLRRICDGYWGKADACSSSALRR